MFWYCTSDLSSCLICWSLRMAYEESLSKTVHSQVLDHEWWHFNVVSSENVISGFHHNERAQLQSITTDDEFLHLLWFCTLSDNPALVWVLCVWLVCCHLPNVWCNRHNVWWYGDWPGNLWNFSASHYLVGEYSLKAANFLMVTGSMYQITYLQFYSI